MKEQPRNRWIAFLGGKTSYYVLGLILLSTFLVFMLNKISFIFQPVATIIMTILAPIIFAVVIYYICNPFVSWLERKLSRQWGVIVVYVIAMLIIGGIGFVGIRALVDETRDLIQKFPTILDKTQKGFESFVTQSSFKNQIDPLLSEINEATEKALSALGDNWQDGIAGIGSFFSAVTSTVITLFVGPMIAFFLLRDKRQFAQTVLAIVPPKFRSDFKSIVKQADKQLGGFLKGQVVAAIALGIMYWIAFLLMGLNYATVIAFSAGILSIVPYVGAFVAFIPGLIIAFQQSAFEAILFVIIWFAIQALHGHLVMPQVMGEQLQIHFITIMLVLLVMGDLMGFIGVLFGIPIYTLIKILIQYLFARFKKRYNLYFGDEGKYE